MLQGMNATDSIAFFLFFCGLVSLGLDIIRAMELVTESLKEGRDKAFIAELLEGRVKDLKRSAGVQFAAIFGYFAISFALNAWFAVSRAT